MMEPRIYRAAFLPALIVIVLAMFSLESRPRPLPQGLAADVLFDGASAVATLETIVRRAPDRRTGEEGDARTADFIRGSFERRGFAVEVEEFAEEGEDLVNVVGRRAGASRRQVVVVAARDAGSVPDATGSAADTAALLELARVFEGRPSRRTLVLASVDGSMLGDAGARRLADDLAGSDLVEAVLVLSNLGASSREERPIVPWSNDTSRAPIGLERTLEESLRQELDRPGSATGWRGQLARLGFPLGIGAQGVLLERGLGAVRLSGSGELPPPEERTRLADVDRDRLGELGRAALRTITAIDAGGRPDSGPSTYVTAVSQVMPGWVLSLLALALIAPAAVVAVDAFARARRRRERVGPWLGWLGERVVPFVAALVVANLLVLVGVGPDSPAAAVAPEVHPFDAAAAVVLALTAGAMALAWIAARGIGDGRERGDPSAPGAACTTALVLAMATVLLWLLNPFAALLLVPGLHLWTLAMLPGPAVGRRARVLLVGAGLLVPAGVAIYYLIQLSLDPLAGFWYLFLLVTGHQVGLFTSLLGCVLLGVLAGMAAIVAASREVPPPPDMRPKLRGTPTYAGPGSLGGTDSALGR